MIACYSEYHGSNKKQRIQTKTCISGLSMGTCVSNLKSVAFTVLELLTFNAQKFRGSRDPGHASFGKIFERSCPDCPGNTCVKFEVRSFNRFGAISILRPKMWGSRDRGHAPFWENFWRSRPDCPGNTCVKFEVRSFNRFGANSI